MMKNKILFTVILLIYIFVPILIYNNKFLYDIKFYILTGLGIIN